MRIDYCREDIECIENYESAKSDNFKGWLVHHRLETHKWSKKEKKWIWREVHEAIEADTLKALNLYFFRPARELIFLKKGEHLSWHSKLYNHIANSGTWKLGHRPWNYNLKMNDEVKNKISRTMKERYENGLCTGFQANQWKKGQPAWNKGLKMSDESKKKLSDSRKGMKWYTDGTKSKLYKEGEEPEGWIKGRGSILKKSAKAAQRRRFNSL